MAPEQIVEYLDNAATRKEFFDRVGQIVKTMQETKYPCYRAHEAYEDYIITKRGKRALGGFFQPTKANVRAKALAIWAETH